MQNDLDNISSEVLSLFSPAEKNVLKHLVAGLDNDSIAERCFISESTVRFHLQRMFKKAGVKNRSQLIILALTKAQSAA